ncbi:hypothetical protein L1887_51432 [Cichorium endivia]|nr:hypothetical protein L1887_51432 [Cichorium endivia]
MISAGVGRLSDGRRLDAALLETGIGAERVSGGRGSGFDQLFGIALPPLVCEDLCAQLGLGRGDALALGQQHGVLGPPWSPGFAFDGVSVAHGRVANPALARQRGPGHFDLFERLARLEQLFLGSLDGCVSLPDVHALALVVLCCGAREAHGKLVRTGKLEHHVGVVYGTRDLCDVGAVALFGRKGIDETRDDVSDGLGSELVLVVDVAEPEPVLLPVDADDDAFASDLFVRVEAILLSDAAGLELHMVAWHDVPEGDAVLGLDELGSVCGVRGGSDGELGALGWWVEVAEGAQDAA